MHAETLNLRHLAAFREIGELGRLSLAAERVHLSQPAVTQAMTGLERTVASGLLLRRPSGTFLTDNGKMFHRRVKRALSLIEQGAQGVLREGRSAPVDRAFHRNITTTQLRALIATGEHGSFSAAARELGTSQPSLHRAARDLERLSGVPLFVKTPQGIALSKAAAGLARSARLAFSELRQGLDEIAANNGIDGSVITVGSLPLARTNLLPKAINRLARTRPQVTVKVVDGPYRDLLHALRHGEIDMIVGALRRPPPFDDVKEVKLFDDSLAIVARAGHPLAGASPPTIDDLCRYPWVVPRRGTPTRDQFEKLFAGTGGTGNLQLVETSSLVLIRGLLTGSDRLTLISENQIAFELEQRVLVRLKLRLAGTTRPIGLTTRRDWHPTGTQSEMLEMIRQVAPRSCT